jgi:predicted PurR-regulated permease PerM
MKTLLMSVVQLVLVAIVYLVAYRDGYRAAQAKASLIVREFASPMERLVEDLNRTVDEALEREENRPGR